jgi:hypothetical protein
MPLIIKNIAIGQIRSKASNDIVEVVSTPSVDLTTSATTTAIATKQRT